MLKESIGLYIHVPFCKSKCYYCDFNSFPNMDSYVEPYFGALKKELLICSRDFRNKKLNTIFIGGGTPSYVHEGLITTLIELVGMNYDIASNAEISIEANPGTLSYEKLKAYKDCGINRLSIGLQAWQDRILKSLGRVHDNKDFLKNYYDARDVGFDNINVDLIFGIPGQTLEDWHETIKNVVSLEPTHLSCYSLKIEDNTIFGKMLNQGDLKPIDDELDRKMYYELKNQLNFNGYKHYEISNFSKDGYQCRHNLIYWKALNYIGVGAGAHSYVGNIRYCNRDSIKEYIDCINNEKLPKIELENLTENDKLSEYIILGLRLIEGIDVLEINNRFKIDFNLKFQKEIEKLLERGFIIARGNKIMLTELGLDLANEVYMEFI